MLKKANVFLTEDSAESISKRAERLITEACKAAGIELGQVNLGKVSELAQSFAVTGPAAVVAAIAQADEVKEVLQAGDADDVLIKPVTNHPDENRNGQVKRRYR